MLAIITTAVIAIYGFQWLYVRYRRNTPKAIAQQLLDKETAEADKAFDEAAFKMFLMWKTECGISVSQLMRLANNNYTPMYEKEAAQLQIDKLSGCLKLAIDELKVIREDSRTKAYERYKERLKRDLSVMERIFVKGL